MRGPTLISIWDGDTAAFESAAAEVGCLGVFIGAVFS